MRIVADVLASLVQKSLVFFEESTGRYRLLESVRHYARERFLNCEAGEEEKWRVKHRNHYSALAEDSHENRFTAESPELMGALEREYDNCRAGLDFCESCSEAESHQRLAGSLWWFWYKRGYLQEGRERLARALARIDGQGHTCPRALALNGAANLARMQADLDAALPLFEQSAEIWREQNQPFELAIVLNNLGCTEQEYGRFEVAQDYFDESLASMRELDNVYGIALVLSNCGWNAHLVDNQIRARDLFEEAIAICRKSGNQHMLEVAVGNLAVIATVEGDFAEARSMFRETLDLQAASPNDYSFVRTLVSVAGLAARVKWTEHGIRLFVTAAAMRDRGGMPIPPSERIIHNRVEALLRTQLTAEAYAKEWGEGFALTRPEALALVQEVLEDSA